MQQQPNNPLHGVKLADIVSLLHEHYGWETLGEMIDIRCFKFDPSVKSSLKFLRKTPWARAKVEALYIETTQGEQKGNKTQKPKYPKESEW